VKANDDVELGLTVGRGPLVGVIFVGTSVDAAVEAAVGAAVGAAVESVAGPAVEAEAGSPVVAGVGPVVGAAVVVAVDGESVEPEFGFFVGSITNGSSGAMIFSLHCVIPVLPSPFVVLPAGQGVHC